RGQRIDGSDRRPRLNPDAVRPRHRVPHEEVRPAVPVEIARAHDLPRRAQDRRKDRAAEDRATGIHVPDGARPCRVVAPDDVGDSIAKGDLAAAIEVPWLVVKGFGYYFHVRV